MTPRSYNILVPKEEAFDRLTCLAADLFDAPIALLNFVGAASLFRLE